jgi:hypothetical protein
MLQKVNLKTISTTLIITVGAVILSGCSDTTITGDGTLTNKAYPVKAYSCLEVSGNFTTSWMPSGQAKLSISTDKNLLDYIEVTNENNCLVIKPKENYTLKSSQNPVTITTSSKLLNQVRFSGASTYNLKNLNSKSLKIHQSGTSNGSIDGKVDFLSVNMSGASIMNSTNLTSQNISLYISGASIISLDGKTKLLSINTSGSSIFDGLNLTSQSVRILASGSSNNKVYTTTTLDVSSSGSAEVYYKGNPQITSHTSGSSRLTSVG